MDLSAGLLPLGDNAVPIHLWRHSRDPIMLECKDKQDAVSFHKKFIDW